MKTKQILTLLLLLISVAFYSQDIRKNIDQVLDTLNKSGNEYKIKNTLISTKVLRKYLYTLRKLEDKNKSFTGKFNFRFELNDSQNSEKIDFTVGVDLKKGIFPGEFNFNSSLTVQLINEKLIENLSSLNMSYDYHFNNKLNFEGYGFIKRTSNNFLNINQRYEVGSGVVWNIYFSGNKKYSQGIKDKKGIISKGDSLLINLERVRDELVNEFKIKLKGVFKIKNPNNTEVKVDSIKHCNKLIVSKFKFKDTALKSFEESYDRNEKVIKKSESSIRISLLAGLNYEVETTNDSLQLFYKKIDTIKNSFKPKNLGRFVVGPNFELKVNELAFNTRAYFKIGVLEDYRTKIFSNDNLLINRVIDYRIEWTTTATLKLSEKISFTGKLDFVYLNAPNRQIINIADDPLIDPPKFRLYKAANKFVKLKFGLTYKL